MSVRAFYKRLVKQAMRPSRRSSDGFTLLELLISIAIGSILITGLMAIIVDFLNIDRREVVLEQTQQDMSRALDYIADDMREAVYVYPDPIAVTDELTDEPDGTPVLAFWRPDPIETGIPADCTAFDAVEQEICDVLQLRKAAYSLVVYFERDNDEAPDDETWVGPSQIVRYELERFEDLATLEENSGYVDPTSSSFQNWERREGENTDGNPPLVLVDLVDSDDTPFNRAPLTDAAGPCTDSGPGYSVVPADTATDTNTNFFACIRDPLPDDPGADPDDVGSSNQDVYVFLRGNVSNLAGRTLALGASRQSNSGLPPLEERILIRGVLDKDPEN